ncbi:MAG: thermostable hemolysin [Halioglobus sp.]
MNLNHGSSKESLRLPTKNSSSTELAVVNVCSYGSPEREPLERYISSVFQAAYGAKILDYLPLLFSLSQPNGHYSAALGLGSAAHGSLFSEQYLNHSVENYIDDHFACQCGRQNIMELGNLVSSYSGQSAFLYLLVTAAMAQAGVEYLLFCANKTVRASIKRSGFTPVVIDQAHPERLGGRASDWGSYYEGEPMVMLGDIKLSLAQASAQPFMRDVLKIYADPIATLSNVIVAHNL